MDGWMRDGWMVMNKWMDGDEGMMGGGWVMGGRWMTRDDGG